MAKKTLNKPKPLPGWGQQPLHVTKSKADAPVISEEKKKSAEEEAVHHIEAHNNLKPEDLPAFLRMNFENAGAIPVKKSAPKKAAPKKAAPKKAAKKAGKKK